MAHIYADKVKQTCNFTQGGTINLVSSYGGYQTFNAVMGAGDTCYYSIIENGTNNWEIGLGTFDGVDKITRTQVLSSSNGVPPNYNMVTTWDSSYKDIFITQPSASILNAYSIGTYSGESFQAEVASGYAGGVSIGHDNLTTHNSGKLVVSSTWSSLILFNQLDSTKNSSITLTDSNLALDAAHVNINGTELIATPTELNYLTTVLTQDNIGLIMNKQLGFFSTVNKTAINQDNCRDTTIIAPVENNSMMCSFDSSIVATGAYTYNHLAGFQDRLTFSGSNTLNEMWGFYSNPTHNGTGTLNTRYAMRVLDINGTGPVGVNYGFYIGPLTRGTENYAIFTVGSTPSVFGGYVGFGGLSIPKANIHVGKDIAASTERSTTAIFAAEATGTAYATTLANTATATTDNKVLTSYTFGQAWPSTASIGAVLENSSNGATGLTFGTYGSSSIVERVRISSDGTLKALVKVETPTLKLTGLGNYLSNAAAISAGLAVGELYRNGDNLCVVH